MADIKIFVNGTEVIFPDDDQQPEIILVPDEEQYGDIKRRLMIPLRGVFSAVGFSDKNIGYDDVTRTVTIVNSQYEFKFVIGSKDYSVKDIESDVYLELDPLDSVPYINSMERTMLPLKAPLEAIGCQVAWDARNSIVYITADIKPGNVSGTVYQGNETKNYGSGTFEVYWWKTTNTDISLVSTIIENKGSTIKDWPGSCRNAVNGPLFPNDYENNNMVNSFAIYNSITVLPSDTPANVNGSQNWENMWVGEDSHPEGPLDFMMDPKVKNSSSLVVLGNGGTFPVINTLNGETYQMSDINWGLGGMDLELSNSSYDDRSTFNSGWKWRGYWILLQFKI